LEVTEEQLADYKFVLDLVLIGQDVFHVQNRVLSKVSKRHPNLAAFKADIKRTFSQVSTNAERLKANSSQELKEAITCAAKKLSQDILALMRWQSFQEKESLEARSLRLLTQVRAEEPMPAEAADASVAADVEEHHADIDQHIVDAVAELHPDAPLDQMIFRKLKVTDVPDVRTISLARVWFLPFVEKSEKIHFCV
jgi:hypothetical protein